MYYFILTNDLVMLESESNVELLSLAISSFLLLPTCQMYGALDPCICVYLYAALPWTNKNVLLCKAIPKTRKHSTSAFKLYNYNIIEISRIHWHSSHHWSYTVLRTVLVNHILSASYIFTLLIFIHIKTWEFNTCFPAQREINISFRGPQWINLRLFPFLGLR